MKRQYYSARTGKNHKVDLDLPSLLKLFYAVYKRFVDSRYFDEIFDPYSEWWASHKKFDYPIEVYLFKQTHKTNLWPIKDNYTNYSREDMFDIIEFLYDCVSRPKDYYMYEENPFEREPGRQEFRAEINSLLCYYENGHELSESGEIVVLPDSGLDSLFEEQLPKHDPENVENRIESAIKKFRSSRSSLDDRRDAVRSLADVLEFLRPKLKTVITTKDENDLFNIANSFGIRHHRQKEKTEYDKSIWYDWMFYYYLATIVRLNCYSKSMRVYRLVFKRGVTS